MVNSSLLLEDEKGINLLSEDIAVSLRSLQELLTSLSEEGEGPRQTSPAGRNYVDPEFLKSFFYGDEEDPYEEGEDEEEEDYPVPVKEETKKLRDAVRATPKKEREDNYQEFVRQVSYEKASSAQKAAAVVQHNNINYPSDRAFHSIVIENRTPTNVYDSLVVTAMSHNLQIETKWYDTWGEGGMVVESINGVRNGDNGYFWEYVVNGKIPDISADKYQLTPHDITEWRLLKKTEIKC